MTDRRAPTPVTAYHGDPVFRAAFLAEIAKHEAADAFLQGTYGKTNGTFRGCAVGCSLRSLHRLKGRPLDSDTADHQQLADDLGWPLWLVDLDEHIFERLPPEQARTWPVSLSTAIPAGAAIGDVELARTLRWSLADPDYGVRHATDDEEVRGIVDRMATLFDRVIVGDRPADSEWDAAAEAAWGAWGAWGAWDARVARVAWGAWDARVARVARAWDADKAQGFYPALAEHVITTLGALAPTDPDSVR